MTQWFVECNTVDNELLASFLSQHGLGTDDNQHIGMLDSEGKSHDVWEVPGHLMERLKQAKFLRRNDPLFRFKFWKRDNRGQPLRSANFLETRKRSRKVKKALSDLELIKARQVEKK